MLHRLFKAAYLQAHQCIFEGKPEFSGNAHSVRTELIFLLISHDAHLIISRFLCTATAVCRCLVTVLVSFTADQSLMHVPPFSFLTPPCCPPFSLYFPLPPSDGQNEFSIPPPPLLDFGCQWQQRSVPYPFFIYYF